MCLSIVDAMTVEFFGIRIHGGYPGAYFDMAATIVMASLLLWLVAHDVRHVWRRWRGNA